MMKFHWFAALLVAGLVAGCSAPAANLDPESPNNFVAPPSRTITLAIQPTDNADAVKDKATELEEFLESSMKAKGVDADIVIYVPLSNAGVVEALRFGHADVAMMSAWPASLAASRAGARVELAEMREVIHGENATVAPYYYSYYVVAKDSSYQTLDDVKGKTVAYSSATSTSGYIFPVAKLVEEGLVAAPAAGKEANPKEHFGNVVFAGGYAQAYEALKSGQVDVTVTAGDINAALYHEVLNNTRIIETQGPIPSHAVVFAQDFTGMEAAALKDSLLELKGEHKDLMRKLVSGIFVEFQETTTEQHIAGLTGALTTTGLKFQDKL